MTAQNAPRLAPSGPFLTSGAVLDRGCQSIDHVVTVGPGGDLIWEYVVPQDGLMVLDAFISWQNNSANPCTTGLQCLIDGNLLALPSYPGPGTSNNNQSLSNAPALAAQTGTNVFMAEFPVAKGQHVQLYASSLNIDLVDSVFRWQLIGA